MDNPVPTSIQGADPGHAGDGYGVSGSSPPVRRRARQLVEDARRGGDDLTPERMAGLAVCLTEHVEIASDEASRVVEWAESRGRELRGANMARGYTGAAAATTSVEQVSASLARMSEADRARAYQRALKRGPAPESTEPSREDRLIARASRLGRFVREGVPPVLTLPGLGDGVVYEKAVTSLVGFPESGKTTIAQRIALDAMHEGDWHVVYFDWEASEEEVFERMAALARGRDIDDDRLAELLDTRFLYVGGPALDLNRWDEIEEFWEAEPRTLGVWDSFSKALHALGLDENKPSEVVRLSQPINRLSKGRGVPNILIDHFKRNPQKGERHAARGASSKLADVDGEWKVEAPEPFSQGEAGEVHLSRNKQRRGRLRRGVFLTVGDGLGDLPIREIDAGEAMTPRGDAKREVVAYLASEPGVKRTKTDVRENVPGRSVIIDAILDGFAADPEGLVKFEAEARGRTTVSRYWIEPEDAAGLLRSGRGGTADDAAPVC